MDRIVIFGDIHANLPALEAVWAAMERHGAAPRYCLGDLVGYGVHPNEVVAWLRDHAVPAIMGNYDLGVGRDSDDCGCAYKDATAEALGHRSIAWSNAHTTPANKAYLRRLAPDIALQLGGLRVRLVHGSPRRVNEYLYADRPDAGLERLLDLAEADVLVCGHTHLPYHRVLPSGRHVINAGSVGKPKDGDPRAGYITLAVTGREVAVEFIRVPYDVERAAAAIEASPMPTEYAAMLRTGTG
ncbi:MAG TPA: metallophosphoesterase family protein [Chloroflexia bacterium]|nr:metallophosphoesterase family protein [Chloroflexia bacterium]